MKTERPTEVPVMHSTPADTDRRAPAPGVVAGAHRVVLIGSSGLGFDLNAVDGLEIAPVESAFEAIGEIADAVTDGLAGRTTVLLGAGAGRPESPEMLINALRRIDPGVRAFRVAQQPDAAFDGTILPSATVERVRTLLIGPSVQHETAKPGTNRPETNRPETNRPETNRPETNRPESATNESAPPMMPADAAPAVNARSVERFVSRGAEPTPDEPIADAALAERLATGGDVVELALAMIGRRMRRADVRFVDADAERAAWGGRVACHVRAGGREAGVLLLNESDADGPEGPMLLRELESHAAWLGSWLGLSRRHHGLRRAALTDPLTGAWNRRYFESFLSSCMEQARRDRLTVTLLLFDIDSFKSYNDRFGHAAGDEILVETVRALESVVRPTDRVCRVGGDEFAVVFFEPQGPRQAGSRPPENVYVLTRRVQEQIRQSKFPKLGQSAAGTLTISGGLATYPWDGHDVETLLERADQLSMRSKASGKNSITLGPGAERVCKSTDTDR